MTARPALALALLLIAAPALGQTTKTLPDGTPINPANVPPVAAPPVAAGPAAPEHECDRLAQPSRAVMGNLPALVEGVPATAIRAPAARAACARALAEFPAEARFLAFAARAADRAGDAREAVRLYRLAADQGYALAQNNLAAMFSRGEGGLPRSEREAERLYRAAADQGFPAAMSNLGTLYLAGRGGVPRNEREAVRLFRAAADTGEDAGQVNLGTMYAEGRGGLPRDMREAARLWREAAAGGSVEARNNLRRAGLGG